MTSLDWPALIRAGLRDLRLTPDLFWGLTPFELGLMLGLDQSKAPMNRAGLEEMIRAFPDDVRTSDGRD